MSRQLTEEDARQSLNNHIQEKAFAIREKYGEHFGWHQLMALLEDREFVRYPCEIQFNEDQLIEGEFAYPGPKSDNPADGYILYVHPYFSTQPSQVPFLVLYHLVVVNYGDFAGPDDAEVFGATVLGISRENYYQQLCNMADLVG